MAYKPEPRSRQAIVLENEDLKSDPEVLGNSLTVFFVRNRRKLIERGDEVFCELLIADGRANL